MERRILNYNEAFMEIHGDASAVIRQLPSKVSAVVVTPDTPTACRIPDLSPGGRRNLAHLRVQGQRIIVSGCAPAVSFLVAHLSGVPDRSPLPTDLPLTTYFLTIPCAAPYRRTVSCFAPRPEGLRRGDQPDLFG